MIDGDVAMALMESKGGKAPTTSASKGTKRPIEEVDGVDGARSTGGTDDTDKVDPAVLDDLLAQVEKTKLDTMPNEYHLYV